MFKKTSRKVRTTLFATLMVLIGTVGLAAPAFANSYFEATLFPWSEKSWCAEGYKVQGSTTYRVRLADSSPNGGHFWVDDANGRFIGNGIRVDRGQERCGAYQRSRYAGKVTMYGREVGHGPFQDRVRGWYSFNGTCPG